MNTSDIPFLRLISQHLAASRFSSPKEIVTWMCATQAQDFSMAKWAIGIRLPGSTETAIEGAINQGEILRTHLMRPTWHFVVAEDICWLLELTAPQIIASQSSRDRDLELTQEVYNRSNTIIEKALRARGPLSREDLVVELNRAGIATDQNRAAHLLMRAELEKIICSGAIIKGKPSYTLLSERVKDSRTMTKDEALAELARRYFASRCPATQQDFTWWSGLPARDASYALELVKRDFTQEVIDGSTYWLPQDFTFPQLSHPYVHLLPNYDEFILSYSNRTASIPAELEKHMKEISDRGVFWPILVIDGQATGIWKRTVKKETVVVEIQPFSTIDPSILALIEHAAADFAKFSGRQLDFFYG